MGAQFGNSKDESPFYETPEEVKKRQAWERKEIERDPRWKHQEDYWKNRQDTAGQIHRLYRPDLIPKSKEQEHAKTHRKEESAKPRIEQD